MEPSGTTFRGSAELSEGGLLVKKWRFQGEKWWNYFSSKMYVYPWVTDTCKGYQIKGNKKSCQEMPQNVLKMVYLVKINSKFRWFYAIFSCFPCFKDHTFFLKSCDFLTHGIWPWMHVKNRGTTLQSMMNAKLSPHRFWPCHENGLIKTIQTIPHNLYVSVKLTALY